MIKTLLDKKARIRFAWMMLSILGLELICPSFAWALSSGPVQPEVQGFEPVGTTDMVDMFTGDFVYNIPLLDVEGYPINIAYHGGVTMEQEASWVGLGWNITPGSVNHAIRGLPDEFDGDTIEKEVNIKPEITKKIGLAGTAELFGVGDPKISLDATLGGYLNMSNYRGVSVDFTASAGINTSFQMVSAGLNVGASVGSQSGASVNYGASLGVGISQSMSHDLNGTFNLNTGGVYSPRTGLKRDKGFDVKLNVMQNASVSTGTSVPIGLQNYTAAITNQSYMNSYSGQVKLGGELFGVYGNVKVQGSVATIKYDQNGSRRGYGYFNLPHSNDSDLLDFSREKDGMFNTTMHLLPQAHLTYDIYSVNGQGTGGSFRPFRNDIGSVFDPVTQSEQKSESGGAEAGLGDLFSAGGEFTKSTTNLESGPWQDYKRKFTGLNPVTAGYYEDVYFKEAGELTENNETYLNGIGNTQIVTPEQAGNISLVKPGAGKRIVRANHIYTHTGSYLDMLALVDTKDLISYNDKDGFKNYPGISKTAIARVDNSNRKLKRKTSHITEIVQTQKDGRRYVYGLPVLNNVEKEVTFAIDTNSNKLDRKTNLVTYDQGKDDSKNNNKGKDHYYSASVTPSYVTAHLLTGVLSADYVDVTGNGISDDDLGSYTKFNYSRKSADYRWRAPIESGRAQYSPGYYTDRQDDKASYTIGSREQWMLHSIETRNYVAEFYVSERKDAMGVTDAILTGSVYNEAPYNAAGTTADNKSYKLDSIVLYNKHDRFINNVKAQPIKTIYFSYDYSLCKGIPNFNGPDSIGKLTLNKIQIKYGSSNLSMSAAYGFKYSDFNPNYNNADKDRWGFFKPSDPQWTNFQFPFTAQGNITNQYAQAWSLSEVSLPSGGVIKVDYESDDYAYVQDKEAMEMFRITGMGNSTDYSNGSELYFTPGQPNLYFYFDRRTGDENSQLSFADNYLKGTKYLYYNVPVELKAGLYEPVKGYAEVEEVGACPDGKHGYVRVSPRKLDGSSYSVNPVVFTALNLGRYSLPHILFPGADPESSDIDNIVKGLWCSIKELFSMAKNPLQTLIEQHKGQATEIAHAFMRLTSPGLKKKGGGQRVKSVRFFDNWAQMAGGNDATYGKTYDYTMDREDGKGVISSGVASYEPLIGGDELPQLIPVNYVAQAGTNFPPNDPVELYQELPIGESFFPSPVVGYRNIRVHSINVDKGRSSQTEDIYGFYTAKDYPIQVSFSPLNSSGSTHFSLKDVEVTQSATQGFSIVLNDMHGKPRNVEHWVLKPAGGSGARELVNYEKYEYRTQNGQLDNMVPAYSYNAGMGQLQVVNKKVGIETDVTIDSRMRKEETKMYEVSTNLNGFVVWILPIAIPLVYPFSYGNKVNFKCATVTKVTQQYGVIDKVISNKEGAITQVNNEVFDPQTGNVLVTSVNNEFGDRTYSVNTPAYWAYKEMGPAYENHDLYGVFSSPLIIDSLAGYADKFVNYNNAFSSHYDLPRKMIVARTIVNEQMPQFKIGDELLLPATPMGIPVHLWVMGYSADKDNCYLILAPREPYKQDPFWIRGTTYSNIIYRVVRSGNRNRLGETIQSYTTMNRNNVMPYLKDDLDQLISLNATQYDHKLDQVFAANQASDSLNPFVTGKVDQYRPSQQVINLTDREYSGGATRNAGLFSSSAYWRTEQDNIPAYCAVSAPPSPCDNLFDSLKFVYLGGDSIKITYKSKEKCGEQSSFKFLYNDVARYIPCIGVAPWVGVGSCYPMQLPDKFTFTGNVPHSFVIHNANFLFGNIMQTPDMCWNYMTILYKDACCTGLFQVSFPEVWSSGTPFTPTISIAKRLHSWSEPLACKTNLQMPGASPDPNYPYYNAPLAPGVIAGAKFDTTTAPLSTFGNAPTTHYVSSKIQMGKVGHYPGADNENWVKTQQVTKYNWFGQELENKDEGVGYNSAVYGYNQQQPVCVSRNARSGEVLFDGFEDYALLRAVPDANASYMPLMYSPFEPFVQATNPLGIAYNVSTLAGSGGAFNITAEDAHSGMYSIKVPSADLIVPLNADAPGMANGYSFKVADSSKYIINLWLRPTSVNIYAATQDFGGNAALLMDNAANGLTTTSVLTPSSNIIEGWQQYTLTADIPAGYKNFRLKLGRGFLYDDIRVYPYAANSKAFVYHPVTRKVTAILDENNYTTFYEYDPEGNLVRTKKETEKGILTISESRSTHFKK